MSPRDSPQAPLAIKQAERMLPLYGKYCNRRIRVPHVYVMQKYLAARRKQTRPRDIWPRAAVLCSACGVFRSEEQSLKNHGAVKVGSVIAVMRIYGLDSLLSARISSHINSLSFVSGLSHFGDGVTVSGASSLDVSLTPKSFTRVSFCSFVLDLLLLESHLSPRVCA